jgi:IS5 family transposase
VAAARAAARPELRLLLGLLATATPVLASASTAALATTRAASWAASDAAREAASAAAGEAAADAASTLTAAAAAAAAEAAAAAVVWASRRVQAERTASAQPRGVVAWPERRSTAFTRTPNALHM